MAESMQSGTGQAAVDFWRWVGDRGLAKKPTADARRSAVAEVLDATDSLDVDVRTLNLDDILSRFTNVRASKYRPSSLTAYRSRFKKGIADYIRWLEQPDGWRPDVRTRSTSSKLMMSGVGGSASAGKGKVSNEEGPVAEASPPHLDSVPTTPMVSSSTSHRLTDYPFPIRPGTFAVLSLPSDMTGEEAERVAVFVKALALPEPTPF